MISFVVGYRSDNGRRSELFSSVKHYLKVYDLLSGNELVVEDSDYGPFNRGQARNRAIQKSKGEVLVILDADSVVHHLQLRKALENVSDGSWFLPYNKYFSLEKTFTDYLIRRPVISFQETPVYEHLFPSIETPEPAVAGCLVMTRNDYDKSGGYDERFTGWGEEDRAFALAMNTLVGLYKRVYGPIYHLWHPAPEEERFGQPYFEYNRALCNRYRACNERQTEMLSLVGEHIMNR